MIGVGAAHTQTPRADMTQHAPVVHTPLIVIEVKEKETTGWFSSCAGEEKRLFPRASLTAHYQMGWPGGALEGSARLSLASPAQTEVLGKHAAALISRLPGKQWVIQGDRVTHSWKKKKTDTDTQMDRFLSRQIGWNWCFRCHRSGHGVIINKKLYAAKISDFFLVLFRLILLSVSIHRNTAK